MIRSYYYLSVDKTLVRKYSKHMSNNYRQYFEQNPPKFCCTSEYIEQVEIEDTLGGVHNKAVNGVDGWLPNGDPVEIKSQVFNADSETKKGPYQLRGRSKFGGMSLEVHNEKYSRNELTVVVGADTDGVVYYRYSFRFPAISQYYLHCLEMSQGKSYSNCDVLPKHVMQHESFKMHYIHPNIKNLLFTPKGHKRFTRNWYKTLCEFPEKNLTNIQNLL